MKEKTFVYYFISVFLFSSSLLPPVAVAVDVDVDVDVAVAVAVVVSCVSLCVDSAAAGWIF